MKGKNRYQGRTRKEYKRAKAQTCSTAGKEKNLLCQATGLDKALTKYPRAVNTMPDEYFNMNLKRDILANRFSFFRPLK